MNKNLYNLFNCFDYTQYIDVIRFEMSSGEEKEGYIKLYTYFYSRKRVGVVGNCYSGVKDMYILPLASHDPIPEQLKPLPGKPLWFSFCLL